jgi:hypothetical protein
MKIRALGVKLFLADRQREREGQTGMTKLIDAFKNFAKAPNCIFFLQVIFY